MKIFHSDLTLLNLSKFGIQIPMKDERVLKIVDFLKAQNISLHESFIQDIKLTSRDLERVHDSHYIKRIFGHKTDRSEAIMETFELRNSQGEFHRFNPADAIYPLEDLIEKFLNQTKGSIAAVAEALDSGESFFLGGGFHHAMSFGGRGFCLVNDIVIAARWAQANDLAKNIWIIDVDAHKGDGTAELTYEDPSIHTLSIHMKKGWPLDSSQFDSEGKLYPWFLGSTIDIGIDEGHGSSYRSSLQRGLLDLSMNTPHPDLAIIVQGSDPYEKDELPSASLLKLSKEEMLERDIFLYQFLKDKNIPQAYLMSGGYGQYAYEIYCQFLQAILTT